jgi:hypothetical protein
MKETLEANDLRIGNLVNRYFEKKYDFGSSMEWQPIVFNLDDFKLLKCFKHKPILLTEEWLLKFGFEWSIQHQAHYLSGFDFVIDICTDYSRVIKYRRSGEVITRIKHLHQLQNLYFALTGEELTIKEQ